MTLETITDMISKVGFGPTIGVVAWYFYHVRTHKTIEYLEKQNYDASSKAVREGRR